MEIVRFLAARAKFIRKKEDDNVGLSTDKTIAHPDRSGFVPQKYLEGPGESKWICFGPRQVEFR